MRDNMRIILASASPRRRELLEQIGLDFEVQVSRVEERISSTVPEQVVEELSAQKVEAVLEELMGSGEDAAERTDRSGEAVLIIGADTVVALEGQILGKPADLQDAERMLRMLSGKTHGVYTGVTLLYCPAGGGRESVQRRSFHERTGVAFYPMTEEEISFYTASGDCLDKAGAYGIQGLFARYVKEIQGDYNNVVGLPVGRLYQEAKEWMI